MKTELPPLNDNSPETEVLRLVDKAFDLHAAAQDIRNELSQEHRLVVNEEQFKAQIGLAAILYGDVLFSPTFHIIKPRLASWYERRSRILMARADEANARHSS